MKKIVGSRVIKTGLAIFITALICEWLGWPPVFAVITAIVTIEPTVSQSIKKGIVRFPASAIGSFFAVLFISFFGHSAITYALAAVFTIITTYRLKLYSGLLVATLTSVAMIEVIHTNVIMSFFIRLGTTTIGLLVSTLVNMFVLPPDYKKDIKTKLNSIAERTGLAVEQIFHQYLINDLDKQTCQINLDELDQKVHKIESLIQFQKDESKYHPLTVTEQEEFEYTEKQLVRIKLIIYHMDNILNTPLTELSLTALEREMILESVQELAYSMRQNTPFDLESHRLKLKQLMELYWEDSDKLRQYRQEYTTTFPAEIIVLYELVSIFYLVENYYKESKF
ncbi:aromatic acid exporter family protein [Filobacillus milosensis]|uniref:Aromatic acid exporter family protein n=1 Tax=Filobacillus milosensis TaxID=94137 RepID=A0A4Y8IVB8_9BACI|nr:aromatic acid exporter family protein [Filobacillus milosensis]TFB24258.1 aromatic acid exporter family protein [Filobacillus milosensis]